MLRSFFPILNWLPNYKKSYLRNDLAAGITIGIVLVPQGMAYAMIAGLPPVYGLYAALIPQVIYALMGTSRQLSVGPVAMDSLLVASGLGALALTGIDQYIPMAIFLAFIMGALQFIFGMLKMGFLVNFLSRPVISGFTSAAAIIIALSQLKHLLGVPIERSSQLHLQLIRTFELLDQVNISTFVLGLISILMLIGIKKINKNIPSAVIVVFVSIAISYFIRIDLKGVEVIGQIPKGLPKLSFEFFGDWKQVQALLPIAVTLSLVAFMEAISIAKSIEEKNNLNKVNPNQELIALGVSNMLGSLFQSYPTTGGFSRTAINEQSGAKSGLSFIFSAIIVGLILVFFTSWFYYLPKSTLAAIIIVAVFGLIDFKLAKVLLKNRKDEFLVFLTTFSITLLIGIVEGILTGVLFSLLLLVYRISRPHIAVLGHIEGTPYFKNISRFSNEVTIQDDVIILRFDAQLYFGNKDYFRNKLVGFLDKDKNIKCIILNSESINYIDSSAMKLLAGLHKELLGRGIRLVIAGAIGPTRDLFKSSGLIEQLGSNNYFASTFDAYNEVVLNKKASQLEKKLALEFKVDKK